jgi:pimeloyl-ACP methyl ester carboxylesterase
LKSRFHASVCSQTQSLMDDLNFVGIEVTMFSYAMRVDGTLTRILQAGVSGGVHAIGGSSRFIAIKNSGHAPYFERPWEFNQTLLRFLATLENK